MATTDREPDGTLQILQDEICGHLLYIPAGEEDVYQWDYTNGERFPSEEEAVAWHDEHCPYPRKRALVERLNAS